MMHSLRAWSPIFAALLLCGGAWVWAQAPGFSGRVSGGFQTPATEDADGRRSVLKGTDARHLGDRVYEITAPRVTMFQADDTLDMIIEAPVCQFDQKSNIASSHSALSLKTADGKFALEGEGWVWRPEDSRLIISNNIVSLVRKGAIAGLGTNVVMEAGETNDLVRITSKWFRYLGNEAAFNEDVVVEDGEDRLRCEELRIVFENPGGVQRIEALRKVHLAQGETEVRSGHAIYELADSTIRISEEPKWRSGLREGSAETLLLNRSNNTLFAEGSVYMKLPVEQAMEGGEAVDVADMAREERDFMEVYSNRFSYRESGGTNEAGSAVYEGNVRVVHADGEMRCELLRVHFEPGENRLLEVEAERNVRVVAGPNEAYGDHGVYDPGAEKITLRGSPRWKLEDQEGKSDLLVFYPQLDEVLALGNVEMTLPASSSVELFSAPGQAARREETNRLVKVFSRTFSHQGSLSVFHEDVRVVDDRGEMRCALITVTGGANNEVDRIVAEGGVRIEQPDMTALGERAVYEMSDGTVTLTGGPPRIITPERSMTAESFRINRERNTFTARGQYRINMKAESARPRGKGEE